MLRLRRSRPDLLGDGDTSSFSNHSWFTQMLETLPNLARESVINKDYSCRIDSVYGRIILVFRRCVIIWTAPTKRGVADVDPSCCLLPLPPAERREGDEDGIKTDVSADNVALFSNGNDGEVGALVCSRYGKIRRWNNIRFNDVYIDEILKGLDSKDCISHVEYNCDVFYVVTASGYVHRMAFDYKLDFDASLSLDIINLQGEKATVPGGMLSSFFSFFSGGSGKTPVAVLQHKILVSVPLVFSPSVLASTDDVRKCSTCFLITAGNSLWRVHGTDSAVEGMNMATTLRALMHCGDSAEILCYDVFATKFNQCFVLFHVQGSEGINNSGTYIAQVEAEGSKLSVVRVLSFENVLPISREAQLIVSNSYKEYYAHVVCGDKIIIASFPLGFDGAFEKLGSVEQIVANDTFACGLSSVRQLVCVNPSHVCGVFGPGFTTITSEAQGNAEQLQKMKNVAAAAAAAAAVPPPAASAAAADDDDDDDIPISSSGVIRPSPRINSTQNKLSESDKERLELEKIYRMYSEKGIMNSPSAREEINLRLNQFLLGAKMLEDTILSLAKRFVNRSPEDDLIPSEPRDSRGSKGLVMMRYIKEKEDNYDTFVDLLYYLFSPDTCLAASISPKAVYLIASYGEWLRASFRLREAQASADNESAKNALTSCIREFVGNSSNNFVFDLFYCDVLNLVNFLPVLAARASREAKEMNPRGVFLCAEALYTVVLQLKSRTLADACDMIGPALLEVSHAIEAIVKSVEASDHVDEAFRLLFSKRSEFLTRFAEAYLAGCLSRLRSDDSHAPVPKKEEAFSKVCDLETVRWKNMTREKQDKVLIDEDYQTKGARMLDVLWKAQLFDKAKMLAKEFAVFTTIFVANDVKLTTECLDLFGDMFVIKLLEYWNENQSLSELFNIPFSDSHRTIVLQFLKDISSPYLHLVYLKSHQFAKAAYVLSWRIEGTNSKKEKSEYACIGKMAIRASRLSNEKASCELDELNRSFDFSLEQLADHELVDELRERDDCVPHGVLIEKLVKSGRDDNIKAAADFVKSVGERYDKALEEELSLKLWDNVLRLTPWRKFAKLVAERKLTDSEKDEMIELSKVCVLAKYIYKTVQQNAENDSSYITFREKMISYFVNAFGSYCESLAPISETLESILITVSDNVKRILKGVELSK